VFHVVQTAVAEAAVLSDPDAREFYIARLDRIALGEGVQVLAFGIMDTHVHLVLWVPRSLPTFMRRIGTSFAAYYNRKHGRRGRVFGRVYWCTVIRTDEQLLLTIRYVLRNPVSGGICSLEELTRLPNRTNLPILLGRPHALARDASDTLALFGATPEVARSALLELLALGTGDFDPDKYEKPKGSFRDMSRSSAALRAAFDVEFARKERIRAGWTLERVALYVCEGVGCSVEDLLSGTRRPPVSGARSAFGYLAHVELGATLVAIAKWLGVGSSAVHKGLARGGTLAASLSLSLSREAQRGSGAGREAS